MVPSPRNAEIDEMLTIEPDALRRHHRHGVLRRQERGAQVDVERAVPRLLARVDDGAERRPGRCCSRGCRRVPNASTAAADHRFAVGGLGRVGLEHLRRCRPPPRSSGASPRPARRGGRRAARSRPRGRARRAPALPVPTPGPGVDPAPGDDRDLAFDPAGALHHVLLPRSIGDSVEPFRHAHRVSNAAPASKPPAFVTTATSAPTTCRSPASPRSWRTASVVWPKPACSRPPESWPPQVLSGSSPSEVDAGPAVDERARLAGTAEAQRLQPPHHLDGEAVVELRDVDVGRSEIGAVPHRRGGGVPDPAHVLPLLPRRPAVDDAAHRLDAYRRPQVGRGLGGGHDDRGGAVDGHVAVEQADRRRDHARAEVVVDGQRLAVHRVGVERGVGALRHRDPRELLAGHAEVVQVARRVRRDLARPATARRPGSSHASGPSASGWIEP